MLARNHDVADFCDDKKSYHLGILVLGIMGQKEMGLCRHVLIPTCIKCILAEHVKVKASKLCKLSVIYVQNGD